MDEVWVIRHKQTEDLWKTAKQKSSWSKRSHAKAAWTNAHYDYNTYKHSKFDDQDEYEVVQLADLVDYRDKYLTLVKALEDIDYTAMGLNCGIEDIGIVCRYEAAHYGWEDCYQRVSEAISLSE